MSLETAAPGLTVPVFMEDGSAGAVRARRHGQKRFASQPDWSEGQRRPSTGWVYRLSGYRPHQEKLRETLCTLGNGYFGTRGAAPESRADETHYPGTYIAGCYDRLVSRVRGGTREDESLVNAPNWLPLTFKIGGDKKWFDLASKKILGYEQELDARTGTLSRSVRFEDEKGRVTRVLQKRFVHMEFPHLAGLETTLIPENWSGRVSFRTALDGQVTNSGVALYSPLRGDHLVAEGVSHPQENVICISVRTRQSRILISEAARTRVIKGTQEANPPRRTEKKRGYVSQEFSLKLKNHEAVTLEKIVALYTSRDHAISEPSYAATGAVANAPSFAELVQRQALSWKHLWRRFRVLVEGDDRAALAVHLHNFHVLQTVSMNTVGLDASVPARGLHGEAYRGHIFWDELFIFPLLSNHIPELTRSLLMYRYRRLPEARFLARNAGFEGALYPWQSGSDGREETPGLQLNPISERWWPDNTHLQWHVDVAIAFNVWSYLQASHDIDFLTLYGAEMFLEIARFFAKVAQYNGSRGRYEIRGVMGPDEFHDSYPGAHQPGLNNNAYTNVMAAWVLHTALEMLERIPSGRRNSLSEALGLKTSELSKWRDISRRMFVPFHDGGIISQFEGYENLKDLDWDAYRNKYKNIYRMDRILESEGDSANNYKVSKQADVVMLFYLLSYEELKELFERLGYGLDREQVQKNIDYYLSRTSHGSTLSRVVFSAVLARMNREESWHIAKEALESDLSDIQGGTTEEGIHLGAMAGTVEIIQQCYVGLLPREDVLWMDPCLPKELKRLAFTLYFRGHTFDLEVTQSTLEVYSHQTPSDAIKIGFRGGVFEMHPGERMSFAIQDRSTPARARLAAR